MSVQFTVMSLDFDSFGGPEIHTFDKAEISVGRLSTNDIVLDSPEVSQHHATVRLMDASRAGDVKLSITDMGSTNGTFVENSPITPRAAVVMAPNERIRIGNYLIKPTYINDGKSSASQPRQNEQRESEPREKEHIGSRESEKPSNGSSRGSSYGQEPILAKRTISQKRVSLGDEESEAAKETSASAKSPVSQLTKLFSSKESTARSTARMERPAPLPTQDSLENTEAQVKIGAAAGVAAGHAPVLQVNFEAVRLFNLGGVVRHNGAPLHGVRVDAGSLGATETGAEGKFSFSEIDEGTNYALNFSKPGYRFDRAQVSGALKDNASLEISAIQLFTIRGTILHQGRPLAGVEVDAGSLGKATTGADGSYTFMDVPEGTEYSVRVSKSGFRFQT